MLLLDWLGFLWGTLAGPAPCKCPFFHPASPVPRSPGESAWEKSVCFFYSEHLLLKFLIHMTVKKSAPGGRWDVYNWVAYGHVNTVTMTTASFLFHSSLSCLSTDTNRSVGESPEGALGHAPDLRHLVRTPTQHQPRTTLRKKYDGLHPAPDPGLYQDHAPGHVLGPDPGPGTSREDAENDLPHTLSARSVRWTRPGQLSRDLFECNVHWTICRKLVFCSSILRSLSFVNISW